MALNEQPIGVYADVTGVVNATAAPEIVALLVILNGYIPDPDDTSGATPASPDFANIPPATARAIRAEITAFAAAIAAAPTA